MCFWNKTEMNPIANFLVPAEYVKVFFYKGTNLVNNDELLYKTSKCNVHDFDKLGQSSRL